jgi:methionyl-tRNA formyltransferase
MKIFLFTHGHILGKLILERFQSHQIRVDAVFVEITEKKKNNQKLKHYLMAKNLIKIPSVIFNLTIELIMRRLSKKHVNTFLDFRYENFTQKVYRVSDFNSSQVSNILDDLKPDIIILGGARIIKKKILLKANVGFLNAHPGILPFYRGSDVIYWAYENKDEIGVTVHLVDAGIDTGVILRHKSIENSHSKSIMDLREEANHLSAQLLMEVVQDIFTNGQLPTSVESNNNRYPIYRKMGRLSKFRLEKRSELHE